MDISEIIAVNLKRNREERNLSLGQLADLAGVSKVLLSQLEKGGANPTINSIWKIAGALGLPYSSLLELPDAKASHVRKTDITAMDDAGYRIYCYYPKGADSDVELYQVQMAPGCVHESVGHSPGGTEYFMVLAGRMMLQVEDEEYVLERDDALRFDATVPHTYRNVSDTAVKAVMAISYG